MADTWKSQFVINPDFSQLSVDDGIKTGVWYIIISSNCGNSYHRNYGAMGSKLWCFKVSYKPNTTANGQVRLLQECVEYVLSCKDEYMSYCKTGTCTDILKVKVYSQMQKSFLKENYKNPTKEMSHVSIQTAVAEEIKGSGDKVKQIVIAKLADLEINKRVEAIQTGLGKIKGLQADLKKLDKPDVKNHFPNGEGKLEAISGYSDDLVTKITKAKEGLAKLEKAVDTALEKNDGDSYGKLYEALK